MSNSDCQPTSALVGVPRGLGTLILPAVAVLTVAGCSDQKTTETTEVAVRPAKLVEVSARDNRIPIDLPAIFAAAATAELAFQAAGRVVSISAREGDTVAAGAEIARLDEQALRTELAAAEAQHEVAAADFGRAERLLAEDAISVAAHDQRRTQLEVARSALEAARRRLDDSVLRAPFPGIVAAIHVEAFQNVRPQEAAVTLQSDGAADAIIQVPATLIANTERNDAIDTRVVMDAVPGVEVPGTLHSLSARADPTGQTFEARIAFDPPVGVVVRPGMTGAVRATLVVTGETAGLAVPLEAVFSEAGAQHVWVVDVDTMAVARRRIEVGEGVGEMLPVVGGLQAGETVVAAGVAFLHEGMIVRPYDP